LLRLTTDADAAVRRASLDALRLLNEPRAARAATTALADRETRQAALGYIAALGGPEQTAAVTDLAMRDPSGEVISAVIGMLWKWGHDGKLPENQRRQAQQAVEQVQGASGSLLCWTMAGPHSTAEAESLRGRFATPPSGVSSSPASAPWQTLPPVRPEGRVVAVKPSAESGAVYLAYADVHVAQATDIQCLGTSSGPWRVWVNGRSAHHRDGPAAFQPDGERFDAALTKGANRIMVQFAAGKAQESKPDFQLRFRRRASSAERERLAQAALARAGNADRGRQVFLDVEKSQCLKCHRLGDKGERIGPELTGLGGRFSRMHVIESILEPSRAIGPGFQTVSLLLDDGRVLTGLVLADQDGMLTLADNQGKKHAVPKSAIQQRQPSPLSTMPDGLEKRLSADEFVDLVAFLAAQKATP
jgi:putative heme-binding domain-containing protein